MIRSWQVVVVGIALASGLGCKRDGAAAGPGAAATAAATREPGAPPEIDRITPLPDPLPEVAATVNGRPIPSRGIKMLAEQALQSGRLPVDQKAYAYRQAMHQFIVRELLVQAALARGLSADPKRLEQAETNARSGYKNEAAFRTALGERGMDEATFKSELRAQATADALVNDLRKETPPESVTDDDVKKFYDGNPAQFTSSERVRAAHILVRVPPGTAPDRLAPFRGKAEQALAEIRGGADFAAVAAKRSEDNSTKSRGGEMDPFGRGQMPRELGALEEAIRALSPGQVSDVVETPAGFHVAKLIERLPDEKIAFDAVKEQVRQHLLDQKRHEALQSFVNGLRAKAKIETHL